MPDQSPLSLQAVVVQNDGVFWQDVIDDVVILDMEQGQYFGIENTGATIWRLLEKPVTIAALCDRLTELYDVDRETCETDVLAFAERLHVAGLITIVQTNHE